MAQERVKQLQQKLISQQTQFDNYKVQCKQLQEFLEEESKQKQQEIRKLKQQAIKKQKNYGLLKTQVSQLESENANLKAEITQLKSKVENVKPQVDNTQQYKKQIEQLKNKNNQLLSDYENIKTQKIKIQESSKNNKGAESDKKKVEDALASYKSKVAQLQKANQKLREQINKKPINKQPKSEQSGKKAQKDNKQQQRLKREVEKLQKKITQSQNQTSRAQSKCVKLSKQIKQLKGQLSTLHLQKQGLSRKVKQLNQINNAIKRQQQMKQQEGEQQAKSQLKQSNVTQFMANSVTPVISALVMTKKHYASPFMDIKNDNLIQILKSTKNGCFEKSMGSIKYRLNFIGYESEQIIQNCAQIIKNNLSNGIKSSIVFFGTKKSSKKYLMSNLLAKLKDYLLQRISSSQQQVQATYVNCSSDPEKKAQITVHNGQKVEQLIDKVIDIAHKSPKKPAEKKKTQPKPKARYFKYIQGQDYFQIITSSYTNIILRENMTIMQALNNIAYSRLPNALQPLNCHRHIVLTINPIVSLYDECKNTLAIANCKKAGMQSSNDSQWRETSPIKEQLSDAARKKLQSIERESEQNSLKIRKQQQQIGFYKGKFDELEIRLKNLLNTHRQQNTYLKKSPVTLSYQKMLKFVHSVQAKSTSNNTYNTNKYNEEYNDIVEQQVLHDDNEEVQQDEGGEEDIL